MSREPIVAAGCLVTRHGRKGIEVLLIHRPRYHDWSLPKGKVDGVPKQVHYWRAAVVDAQPFVPNDEVDRTRWMSIDKAVARITRPDDAVLVKLADDPIGTPFVVLRHGNAVKRVEWSGDDVDRPLDESGEAQAEKLVSRLSAYGAARVHSSAARRCSDTVRPYSLATGIPLASEPTLTEQGFHDGPDLALERAGELMMDAWRGQEAVVLCGHRPYLPQLVDHLLALCPGIPAADPWEHPLPDTVPTASMTVLHVHQDEHSGEPQTLALEHHAH
ncbi:MAG: histidine phosphatase family protein [Actinomycetes bacterium]